MLERDKSVHDAIDFARRMAMKYLMLWGGKALRKDVIDEVVQTILLDSLEHADGRALVDAIPRSAKSAVARYLLQMPIVPIPSDAFDRADAGSGSEAATRARERRYHGNDFAELSDDLSVTPNLEDAIDLLRKMWCSPDPEPVRNNVGGEDLTGQTFGRLTAECVVGVKCNRQLWRWRCVCGGSVDVVAKEVKRGHTKSCGCLSREKASARTKKLTEVRNARRAERVRLYT